MSATDAQRQKKLEELIKKDFEDDEKDDENENMTDEQLNMYLARSDEELKMFNDMDQKRYKEEKKDEVMRVIEKRYEEMGKPFNKNLINYRLIQEWEVPSWIRAEPEQFDSGAEYGQGKRLRKQVNYFEEFTDNQFAKIVEAGGDINGNLERLKKRKRNDQGELVEVEEEEEEEAMNPPPAKRQKKKETEESIIQSESNDDEE